MALYYELVALETLIVEKLHPKILFGEEPFNSKEFEQCNLVITEEIQLVRKRLKVATYSYAKEDHRRLYIQQHQFAIIQLKNTLFGFLLPKDADELNETINDPLEAKIYKRCLAALIELFSFIREEFPQYFNYDEKVSAWTLFRLQETLKPRLTKLKKQLSKSGHDPVLINVVIQATINHYNNETGQLPTYKQLHYLKELVRELEKMDEHDFPVAHYPVLVVLLVYLNYNSTAFKNYLVKIIHAEIDKGISLENKIEIISFHYKEISQLPVKPEISLIPHSPSVQLSLATWLFNEISYLEKKQTLGIVAPVQFKETDKADKEKGIYSMFTIEEMGLLLRTLQETELIKNKSMKQAVQSIAEHWHSKNKENISWQYLYNSISTVEMGTIRSLEDKLLGMVNWIRKMRGRM